MIPFLSVDVLVLEKIKVSIDVLFMLVTEGNLSSQCNYFKSTIINKATVPVVISAAAPINYNEKNPKSVPVLMSLPPLLSPCACLTPMQVFWGLSSRIKF